MQNIYNHAWHMVLINVSYPYNFDIIIFKFKWKDTFQTKID